MNGYYSHNITSGLRFPNLHQQIITNIQRNTHIVCLLPMYPRDTTINCDVLFSSQHMSIINRSNHRDEGKVAPSLLDPWFILMRATSFQSPPQGLHMDPYVSRGRQIISVNIGQPSGSTV